MFSEEQAHRVVELLCNMRRDTGELDGDTLVALCPGSSRPGGIPRAAVKGRVRESSVFNWSFGETESEVEILFLGEDFEFFVLPGTREDGAEGLANQIYVPAGERGTAGAKVSGNRILSCAHILCPAGSGQRVLNRKGQSIGLVSNCGPILDGCDFAKVNRFDAALATYEVMNNDEELTFGHYLTTIGSVKVNDTVTKYGAITGPREGRVVCVGGYAVVQNNGVRSVFRDQIVIEDIPGKAPFCEPGDSGALVLDSSERPVGLLFARSTKVEGRYLHIVSPLQPILDHFGVTLVAP